MFALLSQDDIDTWLTEKIASIKKHDIVKDFVIPELTTLGEIINLLSSNSSPTGVVRNFFNSISINYYRVVSFALEKQVYWCHIYLYISRTIVLISLFRISFKVRQCLYKLKFKVSSNLQLNILLKMSMFSSIWWDCHSIL